MASTAAVQDGWMARAALRSAAWAEKWFPDAYVFAVLGVVIVALAAMGFGSTPQATASAFGDGFWSLIPFTMQMAFVVIGGYAVATAPVVARFIDFLARVPRTGRGAVVYVGLVSMLASLLSWGFSLVAGSARTAEEFPGAAQAEPEPLQRRTRPGEWLEYSPLLTVLLSLLAFGWLFNEFANKPVVTAIANLNTYNFLFISLGLLLHWRPRSFLNAVAKAVPSTTGVLIQFPLYGGIAMILTHAAGGDGQTLAHRLSSLFVHVASTDSFALVMGIYSAVLGFFVPSGGGKWIIEAPYVMQAANELKAHLGWAVQVYNAAEALPNLINPFWMLPLLGVLGLKARDIVGFTFIQLLVHIPLVLGLLWLLGMTLAYVPPVMP
ncbi:TIGR00366 family protein [Stenotrophomonas maltophilia]|uniref:TIGR00366 family protein n=1 Tax=Stenotrophomonas maltophilia TaxID=40324 RepID=UPI001AAD6FF7|nr:TIGR00366 family protein [Stenotrophomonas maltophilia]MBO2883555.1 short-chain fatty acid transporter [Stenotrophomonas maltophilia]